MEIGEANIYIFCLKGIVNCNAYNQLLYIDEMRVEMSTLQSPAPVTSSNGLAIIASAIPLTRHLSSFM